MKILCGCNYLFASIAQLLEIAREVWYNCVTNIIYITGR